MSNPVWSIHQTEAIAILLLTRFIHLFRYNNLDSIHEIYFKKKTFGWYNSIANNNNSEKIRKEALLEKMNKYQKRMSNLWGKKWKFCYHKHTNSHSHSFIESQTKFHFFFSVRRYFVNCLMFFFPLHDCLSDQWLWSWTKIKHR